MLFDIVITSGYFNPIHSGHLNYLRDAKVRGNHHVCVVNNDTQVKLKGSVPFMDMFDRHEIVNELKCVDQAYMSIDNDRSISQTLKMLRYAFPDSTMAFLNGGDQTAKTIPESQLCKELKIELVFGVGGQKTQSSSQLIANATSV